MTSLILITKNVGICKIDQIAIVKLLLLFVNVII